MLLTVNWSEAWMMTGIGVGVVFIILIILVLVLLAFNYVAQKTTKDSVVAAPQHTAKPVAEASELDKAAVATALYLYMKSKGDQESGVLTINNTPSAWHAVLNERL